MNQMERHLSEKMERVLHKSEMDVDLLKSKVDKELSKNNLEVKKLQG